MGGARVVVAAPRAITFLRLQPHLDSDVEKVVEMVWSSRILSGYEDFLIVKEIHRLFILLLRLRDGCGLFDLFGDFPSATNNVRPTQGGAAAAARLDTVWRLKMKGVFQGSRCNFNFSWAAM
jgi:hypothetical protein